MPTWCLAANIFSSSWSLTSILPITAFCSYEKAGWFKASVYSSNSSSRGFSSEDELFVAISLLSKFARILYRELEHAWLYDFNRDTNNANFLRVLLSLMHCKSDNSEQLLARISVSLSSWKSRFPRSSKHVPRNRSSNGRHIFNKLHITSTRLELDKSLNHVTTSSLHTISRTHWYYVVYFCWNRGFKDFPYFYTRTILQS